MTPLQRFKRMVWNHLYPIFPYVEHLLLFAHKKRRQRFHIGWLAPGKTLDGLKEHLSTNYQFGNHFVAWEDSDQVLSWRKHDGFDYQFHLRVFKDGELRGHYERTPESAPLAHFFENGETAKNSDFIKFLGPFVSIFRYIQKPQLSPQKKQGEEITFVPTKQ